MKRIFRLAVGLVASLLLGVICSAPVPGASPEKVLAEWAFDRPGDLQGWVPNGDLTDVKVSEDALHCRAIGGDPILELRPLLDVKATPWQVIEVRLRANHDGVAEFFWSNTNQGRFGGFDQAKTTRFYVTGDDQWHTYRLSPFWHAEGKIVRLRFDLYDGTKFDLGHIRIVEPEMPAAMTTAAFDFAKGVQGWQGLNGATLTSAPGHATITAPEASFLISPPVHVDAVENTFIAVRMSADKGRHGTLFFATEKTHGLHSVTFPIEADGQEHTYNIDMLKLKDWKGTIVSLGLRPSDVPGATATLRALKVSDEPQGPAQLKVISFGVDDALPHAGVPTKLSAIVTNTGGSPAADARVSLTLPEGVRLVQSPPARVPTLEFGEETTITWTVQTDKPSKGEAKISLHTGSQPSKTTVSALASLEFTPRLTVPKTGYVPEPKPVRGPFEVGAYYFPGWNTASRWQPITHFPERKPVLGWYEEGSPELADWHIKWAVEHGITFFAYDWYWSQGNRQLEHALHEGYFKARYHHLLKFCLLWANHNPPHTSSREDCIAVTRYWIENYFKRPEHLTVDGKPVMIIFSMERLTTDLGSEGVKAAFEAMRAECQKAGLKGLYIVACVGDAGGARRAALEGYDAVTAYNWPHLGMTGSGMYGPFATLVDGYRRQWEHIIGESPIPLSPLPVCGGWDSRPWHGENNLVRFDRTPELFEKHLRDARALLEQRAAKQKTPQLVLVEAWNEWGEGSYIEPHKQYGFGYLDAIRNAFTDAPKTHDDVSPTDVGLGPYDVPSEAAPRTSWEFTNGLDGWTAFMGTTEARIEKGALSVRTTNNDPALSSPPLKARAHDFSTVTVRMRLKRADGQPLRDLAQLFWVTNRLPESEASSTRFEVIGDGEWHDYTIEVGRNNRWRDTITRLRLDPCNQPGVLVELAAVNLVPRPSEK